MRAQGAVAVHPVRGLPEVEPGDDVAALVLEAIARSGLELLPWDVVVVTHKVVSKAEGAVVDLDTVSPSARAEELAARTGGDPRLIEVVLGESTRVVRTAFGVLICETASGLVCANAGVDRSNVPGAEMATLLPRDPDASAAALRARWLDEAGGRAARGDRLRQLRPALPRGPGQRRHRRRRDARAHRPPRPPRRYAGR